MPDPERPTNREDKATPSHPNRLTKRERLCSKKRIEALFSGGNARSLTAYPLRAAYMVQDDAASAPVQVLVSVSKRRFRHAVDRNRLKRLVREAYRLNKSLLTAPPQGHSLALALIWMSDTRADFPTVEAKVRNLLQRIAEETEKTKSEE